MTELLESSKRRNSKTKPREWFLSWSKSKNELCLSKEILERLVFSDFLMDDNEIETMLKLRHQPSSQLNASFKELSNACEERRAEVKQQNDLVEAYRKIVHALIIYKSGAVATKLSAKQYVGYEVFQRAYSYERKYLQTILMELGFPFGIEDYSLLIH
jgi:hypothetical protein